MTEMVVVRMGDDDRVDERDVVDLAWGRSVTLRTEPGEGRAAVFEDWVEEDAQTRGDLDIVAGVAEPGGTEVGRGGAGGEEGGGADGGAIGRRRVGVVRLPCEPSSE